MSFSQQQASLFTVNVSGRTITPFGVVQINDQRPRTPSGALTLTGIVDGTLYDVYALSVANNHYTLLALPSGTSVVGRTDVILVGALVDYPSATSCNWIPLSGGALDAYVYIDTNGLHIRPLASAYFTSAYSALIFDPAIGFNVPLFIHTSANSATIGNHLPGATTNPLAGLGLSSDGPVAMFGGTTAAVQANGLITIQSIVGETSLNGGAIATQAVYIDAYGHLTFRQNGTPTVAANAVNTTGAGAGASATVSGTDQVGQITLTTGTTPGAVNVSLCTVAFVGAYPLAPYSVELKPANTAALNLARNQDPGVLTADIAAGSFIVRGGSAALAAGTAYAWSYVVSGAHS